MDSNASQEKLPLNYFVLVVGLSVPLWLIGGNALPVPVNLPVSALTAFVPAIAAAILSYRRFGFTGVKELLRKTLDYWRIHNKIWYLPALLLAPSIYLLSYAVMRLRGVPLPDPKIPLLLVPVFFLAFFISDAGEELGWSGYAIDPMQNRWSALKASLILGLFWAIWHSVAFVQTRNPASWVLWQSFKTVAMRVVIVWLYNNTGKSVFAAILYHTTDNVSWTLFPDYGSAYDPFVTGIITGLTAAIVTIGWGPRTLRRYRLARASRA